MKGVDKPIYIVGDINIPQAIIDKTGNRIVKGI